MEANKKSFYPDASPSNNLVFLQRHRNQYYVDKLAEQFDSCFIDGGQHTLSQQATQTIAVQDRDGRIRQAHYINCATVAGVLFSYLKSLPYPLFDHLPFVRLFQANVYRLKEAKYWDFKYKYPEYQLFQSKFREQLTTMMQRDLYTAIILQYVSKIIFLAAGDEPREVKAYADYLCSGLISGSLQPADPLRDNWERKCIRNCLWLVFVMCSHQNDKSGRDAVMRTIECILEKATPRARDEDYYRGVRPRVYAEKPHQKAKLHLRAMKKSHEQKRRFKRAMDAQAAATARQHRRQ